MLKKYLRGYVEKINESEGILDVAIATDSSVDRDGESIDSDGWDFKSFKKNPVLLWAHNYREAPIGKVLDLRKDGDKILFRPQFAINISERAKEAFKFYKEGFLNAFSVGFIPKEKEGEKILKAELLEISAVPVPANPNALVSARSAKDLSKDILSEMEQNIDAKGVIGYKDFGIVENLDAPWDAGREVRQADVETLRKISTWFDAENADNKAAYKLPHHRASDLKAVWRGVSAAMAALLGARGGVDIPSGDRRGVYNHLSKHYAKFDKTPPEFKLIEAQVLKDVDFETEAYIAVQIIHADNEDIKTIKQDVDNIKKSLSRAKAKRESGRKESSKRSSVGEVVKDTKRVLQAVDKNVGEALRELKNIN